MAEKMNAVAVVGERRIEIISIDKPTPKPNEVLVHINACGLCTWEQRVFIGEKKVPLPIVGGHEVAGEICGLGSDVNGDEYKIGTRVAVRVVKSCHSCYYCRSGHEELCVELNTFRMNGPEVFGMGGLAEYMAIDRSAIWQYGDNVPFDTIAMTEPVACVLNSMEKGNVQMGDDAVIIGGGVMGLLHILCARLSGARTILSEPDEGRRRLAKELGCDIVIDPMQTDLLEAIQKLTGGRGADVVFNTTAIPSIAQQAVSITGNAGRCVMYSSQHPDSPISISPNWLHSSEAILTGAVNPSVGSFDRAVKLISKGLLDPSRFISGVRDYHDALDAFIEAIKPDTFRYLISF
ncbi:MAG: alcohol dehydrogenase catalytic domain-containing protein [Anaerolineaceae bacterium]